MVNWTTDEAAGTKAGKQTPTITGLKAPVDDLKSTPPPKPAQKGKKPAKPAKAAVVRRKRKEKYSVAVVKAYFKEMGLPEPIPEHKFHPTRLWRIDFAIIGLRNKVALEVDGGIWMKGGGAHSRPQNIVRDIEKHNALTLCGWKSIRVQPDDLCMETTIMMIRLALAL